MQKYLSLAVVISFSLFTCTYAQNILLPDYLQFEQGKNFNPNITAPDAYLGYQLGASFTIYADIVDYFKQLDEEAERLTLGSYGKTYEGRELIYAIITSEENQSRIETIRQNNLQLADPTQLSAAAAKDLMADQPIVVSFSYNIHGNEASGTEAAIQVAYELAAAMDEGTNELLKNVVFVMFPCINPDGRDRYVYWYKSMQRMIPATSPRDLDHYAPWPNGRTNHYWFDLNRDWIWGVHPESRGHTNIYQQWMPQLHTDYHEMGYNSNYFTMPGTTPRNLLLPDAYERLSDTIGRANIAAFDEHQINYFTREAFDFYYPGYGSSYPSIMGAIGMLVEQGGIGAGLAIETNDNYVLTLRQRVFDHYLTSLATLRKAADQKALFQQYTYDALNPKNSKSPTQTYILPNDQTGYLTDVLNVLKRNNVKIEQAEKSFAVSDALDYRTGKRSRKTFEAGTYLVSTNQAKNLFLNSVLGRNLEIEDSVMYDMATWSAPLAYNLEAYSSKTAVRVGSKTIEAIEDVPYGLTNADANYAYVIEWNQRNAPKALSMLWKMGYQVRAAERAFGNGDQTFSPGSLTILRGRNRAKWANMTADMATIANTAKVEIVGFNTGRMNTGIDLASSSNRPLKQPKVALLVEPPFNTYTCGQLYFLFDQETELPVDRIRASILKQTSLPKLGSRYGYADLEDYDVLILAGGGNSLKQVFAKEQLEALKNWVMDGGTLVATESAANFFTKDQSGMAAVELVETPKDTSETVKYLPYDARSDYYGKKRIPGSALNAKIDISHPLAFGMNDQVYTLKFGNQALKPMEGLQTVGHYTYDAENLLVAGYASPSNLEQLAGNTFAAVQPMGQGQIAYLMDNTQYRMFWLGSMRMMQNAVMLLPSF